MELWKPSPLYPPLEASNWGRIRMPIKSGKMPNGGVRKYGGGGSYGAIQKAGKDATHVYYGAWFRSLGNVKVHRAVCSAFHGAAPFERAVVIHINENALDNRPENLKWGTQKENLNMPKFLDYCRARKGLNSPFVKGRIRKEQEIFEALKS